MLLCYTMLTEVYEDVASHRYIVRKGQGILIALQITLDTPWHYIKLSKWQFLNIKNIKRYVL